MGYKAYPGTDIDNYVITLNVPIRTFNFKLKKFIKIVLRHFIAVIPTAVRIILKIIVKTKNNTKSGHLLTSEIDNVRYQMLNR